MCVRTIESQDVCAVKGRYLEPKKNRKPIYSRHRFEHSCPDVHHHCGPHTFI